MRNWTEVEEPEVEGEVWLETGGAAESLLSFTNQPANAPELVYTLIYSR